MKDLLTFLSIRNISTFSVSLPMWPLVPWPASGITSSWKKCKRFVLSLRAGIQGTDSFDSTEDCCHPPNKKKELPWWEANRVEGRKGKTNHQIFFSFQSSDETRVIKALPVQQPSLTSAKRASKEPSNTTQRCSTPS